MAEIEVQAGADKVPLNGLAQTFTYDGDFVSTITVVYNGVTYVQSFQNDGNHITNVSTWVAQ